MKYRKRYYVSILIFVVTHIAFAMALLWIICPFSGNEKKGVIALLMIASSIILWLQSFWLSRKLYQHGHIELIESCLGIQIWVWLAAGIAFEVILYLVMEYSVQSAEVWSSVIYPIDGGISCLTIKFLYKKNG